MSKIIKKTLCKLFCICFSLFVLFVLSSCEHYVDYLRVDMQDGTEITPKKGLVSYPNEDEFVHAVRFPQNIKYNNDDEIINREYSLNTKYEIKGISKETRCYWEIAKFGEWIRKYGLQPNEQYYVCTTVYLLYTSLPPKSCMFTPQYTSEEMGYSPSLERKTFDITYDWNKNMAIFATCVRTIGYNISGESINVSIPQLENIIWKFQVLNDGWQ